MPPDDSPVSLGEVNRNVEKLASAIEGLRDGLTRNYVAQTTWQQRNETVNTELRGLGREVGELRRALDKKADVEWIREVIGQLRQPPRWPSIVAGIASSISTVLALAAIINTR